MENIVRKTLWLSVPFNFIAAGLLAFPDSVLGQFGGFPSGGPVLYQYLSAWLVIGFGFAYAWSARQDDLPARFIQFASILKIGVFAIAGALCLFSDVSWRLVVVASGDFAFAIIWLVWYSKHNKAGM